jgi:hypothetical protein
MSKHWACSRTQPRALRESVTAADMHWACLRHPTEMARCTCRPTPTSLDESHSTGRASGVDILSGDRSNPGEVTERHAGPDEARRVGGLTQLGGGGPSRLPSLAYGREGARIPTRSNGISGICDSAESTKQRSPLLPRVGPEIRVKPPTEKRLELRGIWLTAGLEIDSNLGNRIHGRACGRSERYPLAPHAAEALRNWWSTKAPTGRQNHSPG